MADGVHSPLARPAPESFLTTRPPELYPLGATRYFPSWSRSVGRSSIPSSSVPSPYALSLLGRFIILACGGRGTAAATALTVDERDKAGRPPAVRDGDDTDDIETAREDDGDQP